MAEKRYIYIVQYEWGVVAISTSLGRAKVLAIQAHMLDNYKYSVWVTKRVLNEPSEEEEVGMFRRNDARELGKWIECDGSPLTDNSWIEREP